MITTAAAPQRSVTRGWCTARTPVSKPSRRLRRVQRLRRLHRARHSEGGARHSGRRSEEGTVGDPPAATAPSCSSCGHRPPSCPPPSTRRPCSALPAAPLCRERAAAAEQQRQKQQQQQLRARWVTLRARWVTLRDHARGSQRRHCSDTRPAGGAPRTTTSTSIRRSAHHLRVS
jgi:hypothetical protein